jgi:HEXXH motif-containing protein
MSNLIAVADALSAPDAAALSLRQFWFADAAQSVIRWHDRLQSARTTGLQDAQRVLSALQVLPAQRVGRCLNAPVPRWCLHQPDDRVAVAGAALAAIDASGAVSDELRGPLGALTGTLSLELTAHWIDTRTGIWESMHDWLLLAQRDAVLAGTTIDAYPKLRAPEARADFRMRLIGALQLLRSAAPGFARAIQGFIRAVIPMQAPVRGLPSTSTNAVPGAICVTATADEALLAEQIMHEGTHALLFLMQEVDPLLDPERHGDGWGEPLLYSPWRDDARPLNGLLHGCAVFLRVAWLHARLADQHAASRRRLAALGPQVRMALEGLQSHACLTRTGRHLLLGLLESEGLLSDCRPEWAGDVIEPLYVECSSILDEVGPAMRRQAAHRGRAKMGTARP